MGGDCGNILDNTGYACMLLQLSKGWVRGPVWESRTTSCASSVPAILIEGSCESNIGAVDAGLGFLT